MKAVEVTRRRFAQDEMDKLLKASKLSDEFNAQASEGLDFRWRRMIDEEMSRLASYPPQIQRRSTQKFGCSDHCQINGIRPLRFD